MIQEEAHEDANIIFGAVIDESITDEIRITVIATGFGEAEEEPKQERKPAPAHNHATVSNITSAPQKNKKVVHLGTIIDDLDTPTWQRKKQGSEEVETVTLNKSSFQFSTDAEQEDKYEIPAFLRRQMD